MRRLRDGPNRFDGGRTVGASAGRVCIYISMSQWLAPHFSGRAPALGELRRRAQKKFRVAAR
jgi:hypothetical protein